MAALIGVQFRDILGDLNPKPPVIVDITTSWAQRYIVKVAALNVMEVYSNHTFQPKKSHEPGRAGRDARPLDRRPEKERRRRSSTRSRIDRMRIADVPPEHFYFQPIAQVLAYQLMELAPDRTFKPEQAVAGREAVQVFELLGGLVK